MTDAQYKALSIREFDEAAEKFDDNDPSIYNLCRKDYPDIVAELIKEPFASVLDAGCGTGAILSMLRENYPDREYTGIDLSSKMIGVARRKEVPGIAFLQGDCENLPFPLKASMPCSARRAFTTTRIPAIFSPAFIAYCGRAAVSFCAI